MAGMAAELARLTRGGRTPRVAAAVLAVATACGLLSACASSGPKVAACTTVLTRPTSQAVDATQPPPVPTHGAYFGAFALTGDPTQTNLIKSFSSLSTSSCRPLDLGHIYLRWATGFPTPQAQALVDQGAYPLVSWTGTDTQTINSGAVDATITATAHQVAALHVPVFLEFRWEMDRANLASTVHSPQDYVAAWDRVHRLFAAAGTTNVSWVWCPTAAAFADGRAEAYYPGDSEVDWVCTDAYPSVAFGTASYQPLSHLLRPFLTWSHGHDKPVMIGEFGVPASYSPAERARWLTEAKTTLTSSPRIKAAAYFDDNPPGVTPDRQFAIGDDPRVIAAFRALATDPYFRPLARS